MRQRQDAARKKIAILGASGYTGAELVRLLSEHEAVEVSVLIAERAAGKNFGQVYPHLAHLDLPVLIKVEEADWSEIDFIFCALPHGTTQKVITGIAESCPDIPVCDLSADFRLRDLEIHEQWYGPHLSPDLRSKSVYGLSEVYREEIRQAKLVANPGCYTTCAELPLIPLLAGGHIKGDDIIIDAKSGVSGAGRAPREATLFCEASGGISAYAIARHRHAPEIEQELSAAAGKAISVTFTPHLAPFNRGMLATIYVKLDEGQTVEKAHAALRNAYEKEPFVYVCDLESCANIHQVRGSNVCYISLHADRLPGRMIICSALDNLLKGASGQAIQNMNLQLGFPETQGLPRTALFP